MSQPVICHRCSHNEAAAWINNVPLCSKCIAARGVGRFVINTKGKSNV